MENNAFTLAMYRVKSGNEDKFIAAWNELADLFVSLPNPPIWGTLIRSVSDPTLFYSFGPWHSGEDVRAMRTNPQAGQLFAKLSELCTELTPGDYELVTHVDVAQRRGVQ